MFEFFFKYSPTVFSRGDLILLGRWPIWSYFALAVGVAAILGLWIWLRRGRMAGRMTKWWRMVAVWALQAVMAALLLALLWQPALRISTLKPQQNIVSVVVDDSRSMSITEGDDSRSAQATEVLEGGLLDDLSEKFQVRMYRMGGQLSRIQSLEQLSPVEQSTRIADSLRQVAVEAGTLPIGAVLLLSDGADNSGGVDLDTINELRARRIPIHTIGFGREQFDHDIEITDAQIPARALADSRLLARVSFRQNGYRGQRVRLKLSESGRVLASKEVELGVNGEQQVETLMFSAGEAGAKSLDVSIDPLENEDNPNNNAIARLVNVESKQPRVLYFEGEPRWEFKFIRRALENDSSVHLVTIVRPTQNKLYRQGVADEEELKDGFPAEVEELFAYDGLILGSVEANYFTAAQQELIEQFADRRGGGVLFLGGRASLADGGYRAVDLANMLPVRLPSAEPTFLREPAAARLTDAGQESLITRLEEDPEANDERWSELPDLADFQEVGEPKPGAVVLANMRTMTGRTLPLLVTQNYGFGRVGVFATGGSWRWQMLQPVEDQTHEIFWQQMLRWLVTGTPGTVTASTPKQVIEDQSEVELNAMVRDKTYAPTMDARVEVNIIGPVGSSDQIELSPDPVDRGHYTAMWHADQPGSYMAEVVARRGEEELGRDVISFRRQDGVAENFRAEQNRELLEQLSSQTGGKYYTPDNLENLTDEISYSEAGITVHEVRELWNMPAIFLVLILLKSAEWWLRRRWGVV